MARAGKKELVHPHRIDWLPITLTIICLGALTLIIRGRSRPMAMGWACDVAES